MIHKEVKLKTSLVIALLMSGCPDPWNLDYFFVWNRRRVRMAGQATVMLLYCIVSLCYFSSYTLTIVDEKK